MHFILLDFQVASVTTILSNWGLSWPPTTSTFCPTVATKSQLSMQCLRTRRTSSVRLGSTLFSSTPMPNWSNSGRVFVNPFRWNYSFASTRMWHGGSWHRRLRLTLQLTISLSPSQLPILTMANDRTKEEAIIFFCYEYISEASGMYCCEFSWAIT